MLVREILEKMEFGNPVAEYDKGLHNYFVETSIFHDLIEGDVDIIAGDKGTGKTAIYQHLKQSYTQSPELAGIQIITGFNPAGEPIFRQLGSNEILGEGQYVTIWKMYFLSLIGNWFLQHYSHHTEEAEQLAILLRQVGLADSGDNAIRVFAQLMNWLRNNLTPKEFGVEMGFNEFGIPVIKPVVGFGKGAEPDKPSPDRISHYEAFTILNNALAREGIRVWVVMDRLDEAFAGRPNLEALALKALLQTLYDLRDYQEFSLKLFIRNDLFRKVIRIEFRNLDHVTAKKKEIVWNDNDLYGLLCQRIRKNRDPLRAIGFVRPGNHQLFAAMFPGQVNSGRAQPSTWKWMLSQIRDGNDVKAPRNLIDLCLIAEEEQLRKEQHTPREYLPGAPLIESDSLRKAASRLSSSRVSDTLLAEYGEELKQAIRMFSHGKSDHTDRSLEALFRMSDPKKLHELIEDLRGIGFLEQIKSGYRIPLLYRKGLHITQGKAQF